MEKKVTKTAAFVAGIAEYASHSSVLGVLLGCYVVIFSAPVIVDSIKKVGASFGHKVLSSGLNGNMYDLENNPHLQVRWNPREVTKRGVLSVKTSGFGGELAAGLYVSAEGAKGATGLVVQSSFASR